MCYTEFQSTAPKYDIRLFFPPFFCLCSFFFEYSRLSIDSKSFFFCFFSRFSLSSSPNSYSNTSFFFFFFFLAYVYSFSRHPPKLHHHWFIKENIDFVLIGIYIKLHSLFPQYTQYKHLSIDK